VSTPARTREAAPNAQRSTAAGGLFLPPPGCASASSREWPWSRRQRQSIRSSASPSRRLGAHTFQAANILAQRYTTGVAGRIVALLAYFRSTGTPSFRMSLYGDAGGLPGDLLAAVEGQAPGAQGWHELALDPAHYLDVTDTTILWIGAQTSANIDSRAPSAELPTQGADCAPSPSAPAPPIRSAPRPHITTPAACA
jgi:hypothetical protein